MPIAGVGDWSAKCIDAKSICPHKMLPNKIQVCLDACYNIMEPLKLAGTHHLEDEYRTARQNCMKLWYPEYTIVDDVVLKKIYYRQEVAHATQLQLDTDAEKATQAYQKSRAAPQAAKSEPYKRPAAAPAKSGSGGASSSSGPAAASSSSKGPAKGKGKGGKKGKK